MRRTCGFNYLKKKEKMNKARLCSVISRDTNNYYCYSVRYDTVCLLPEYIKNSE